MDRKPVILALLALGCEQNITTEPAFDGPVASAVLEVDENVIFEEPVAFVANSRRGTIVPLDVKHGTLLSDQLAAGWIRPRWVATGDERQLDSLAVWAPQPDEVVVFASDIKHDVVVEAPYIVGFDDEPQLVEPAASEPVFDGTGDVELSNIQLRAGYTTTEEWVIRYDGEQWWVDGTASGKQERHPVTGQAYATDRRELGFKLTGSPEQGDRFTLRTETGVVEHDFGGVPLGLLRQGDLLYVSVWDPTVEQGGVAVFDLMTRTELGRIPFPEGAQPWSLAPSDDGVAVFVADARRPAVYRLVVDEADIDASLFREIETPAPVTDMTHVSGEGFDHLFVAPATTNRLEVYQLDEERWIDVNPLDEAGTGLDVLSPIVGLDATPEPIELQQETSWGAPLEGRTVVVTLMNGSMVMAHAETGCLVEDALGPRADFEDTTAFDDNGPTSNPVLLEDEATGDLIQVGTCGGVTRNELWTLTYDGTQGNWIVEGTTTGIQDNRAREDQRYVSDEGEVQFTILAGSQPTTDGDQISFNTEEGVVRIDSVVDPGGTSETALELPGRPLVLQYTGGPSGGGWDLLMRRTFALVPITNSDLVIMHRLDSWTTQVIYE